MVPLGHVMRSYQSQSIAHEQVLDEWYLDKGPLLNKLSAQEIIFGFLVLNFIDLINPSVNYEVLWFTLRKNLQSTVCAVYSSLSLIFPPFSLLVVLLECFCWGVDLAVFEPCAEKRRIRRGRSLEDVLHWWTVTRPAGHRAWLSPEWEQQSIRAT